MNIKSRIKRLEADICPPNRKYGVLIHGYRRNCLNPLIGWNSYMRDGKLVGYISLVFEWANGKIVRMINTDSEEGKKILKELGYEIIDKEASAQG